jgi:hypothetical protein
MEVDLTSDINKGSQLSPGFTWSVYVMERTGVPNVLSYSVYNEHVLVQMALMPSTY